MSASRGALPVDFKRALAEVDALVRKKRRGFCDGLFVGDGRMFS
jgi:hypothetical protein